MTENTSPEEKLLKLIRGQKKPFQAHDKKPPLNTDLTAAEPQDTPKPRQGLVSKKYLSLPGIKKILLLLFAVSIVCLMASFIYPLFGLNKIKLPDLKETKTDSVITESKQNLKSADFYLQGLKDRQIFATISTQAAQDTGKPVNALSADVMKDINLVGIISGDPPQAIIEDKQHKQTLYVTKGQYVGEMQIEDIQEGKIIINYQNQRYELYL